MPLRAPSPVGHRHAAVWFAVSVLLTAGSSACATSIHSAPPQPTRTDSVLAQAQFRVILANHWSYAQTASPEYVFWVEGRVAGLNDISYGAAKDRASFGRAASRELYQVDVDALPEDVFISWLVLEWDMGLLGRSATYLWNDLSLISPRQSPLRTALGMLQRDSITSDADMQRHLYLLTGYARLADSVRAGLAARAARGVGLPRALQSGVLRFVRSLVAPADSSPFAAATRIVGVDSAKQRSFRSQLEEAVASRVNPALKRLATYVERDYARLTTDRLGLWQYPGGKEYYRFLVRSYSTLDITPEDAHAVGLGEVAHLDSLAAGARRASGWPADRDSLRAALQANPRYAVRNLGTVLDRMLAEYAHIAVLLGKAFGRSSEVTTDIQGMPQSVELRGELSLYEPASGPDPTAHYLFNTERWQDRSLLTLAARVHQDLLPGHHYQVALQRENEDLPAFRRLANHAGYVDGWGTYAVELADSLDVDVDSTRHYGSLLHELARACGLVVDTGINYFGWTHDEALGYLRAHLPDSDAELEREVLFPAIEAPGSLIAATLGARELRGLRRWAQRELGERFDLRAFHDEILSLGSVPLPVLGKHLEWWLWRERGKAVSDTGHAASVR